MVRNECNQSGHGSLKLNVSQDWIDEMNWYFACWWKSGKAKSYFNDFWVDVVKNRHGHLVQELLKFAEWVIELIFVCWMWCNNVWLDQHRTLYIWLLNVSLLQLYLLNPWRLLEGPYEIVSAYLSLLTSVWVFSWNHV